MRDNPFGPWTTALSPMSGAKLSTYWVRRLNMLPNLCQSSPILSRRGLFGLLALAVIALLLPSLRGRPSARAVDNGRTPSPVAPTKSPPGSDEEAPDELPRIKVPDKLLRIYRLAPGEDLKLVPHPRPGGLGAWLNREQPGRGGDLDNYAGLVFRWRDPDQLELWGTIGGAGEGFQIRLLPQMFETGIGRHEIKGEPELLETEVSGDWVYREGVPAEQRIRSLEKIIQQTYETPFVLQFRPVERDVVVARGRYHSSPVAGRSKNQVEIYAKKMVANGRGEGGGNGTFREFLTDVGEYIERPVVSEVEAAPESIEWVLNGRTQYTEQERQEDHDEGLVLQHLSEQTGLTFTRERKTKRVLFAERGN